MLLGLICDPELLGLVCELLGLVDWSVLLGLLVLDPELLGLVVDCVVEFVVLCVCELLLSGDVLCGELLCATTQTAERSRIAVIRYVFLIQILLVLWPGGSPALSRYKWRWQV